MDHKPKDVKVKGKSMRKCKRCAICWAEVLEQLVMSQKCPGRQRR